MPEVALPVFKGLYGSDDAMVNISPGITIAANFHLENHLAQQRMDCQV